MLGEDPPGVRLELVNGEVAVSLSPTPEHSHAVIKLIALLEAHISAHDLGELHQDVDTLLDAHNVRRPDILFFRKVRLHLIGSKAIEGPPDLAIEVISPSSVQIDCEDKFAQYQQAGVEHYWLVDPAHRTVEAWQLEEGAYVAAGRGTDQQVLRLPPFPDLDIPLGRLWRKA